MIFSLSGPLSHGSPVVVLTLLEFLFTIPVDVVKSYMNCLFDHVRVVTKLTINILYFVPVWLVSGVVGVLCKGGGLDTGESDVSIVLLNSALCLSFLTLPWQPQISCRSRLKQLFLK